MGSCDAGDEHLQTCQRLNQVAEDLCRERVIDERRFNVPFESGLKLEGKDQWHEMR
jgi:hypothetical protein